jgi:uncharacterized NAD(P)/FAD-binding protein YdhS
MKRIAIIGGGFSGTLTAVNLARFAGIPLEVTLINHGRPSGRGIAYGTRRAEHLLNVAARNMSALADHPNHFVEWLRTRTEFADLPEAELRETFMPRRVYGDYVRSLALQHSRPLDGRSLVETRLVEAEAVDVEPHGSGARVVLADGQALPADQVVLATGNETPAELPGSDELQDHPGYAANPWVDWESRLPDPSEAIVLLGTGLTAVDAIVTLLALGWQGRIHAVSRHGWLPQSHFRAGSHPEFPSPDTDVAALGLAGLLALMEEECARLRSAGGNPAVLVDRLRPHTQRIWQAWSVGERQTFMRHHAARWNVLRHRIAPAIHQQVTKAQADNRLTIHAGSVERLERHGSRVQVHLAAADDQGGTSLPPLSAGLVVNCTGPQTRFSGTRSSLLRNLLDRGSVQPDVMDMGIRINAEFAVIDRANQVSSYLHALGPLLRGTLWETVAVPELRGQALQVARALLKGTPSPAGPQWIRELEFMEYSI